MPLTTAGIYYADTSTTMSIADITAAMATSIGKAIKVLQVVQYSSSAAKTSSSTTFTSSNLTGTITPKYEDSKVLVLIQQAGINKTSGNSGNGIWLRLTSNGTPVYTFANNLLQTGTAVAMSGQASGVYLHSPASTSAVTYATEFRNNVAAAAVGCQVDSSTSTLTLIEIGA